METSSGPGFGDHLKYEGLDFRHWNFRMQRRPRTHGYAVGPFLWFDVTMEGLVLARYDV